MASRKRRRTPPANPTRAAALVYDTASHGRVRLPVHARMYGTYVTLCGLKPGWVKGQYANDPRYGNADVPWGRASQRLGDVTCELCLVAIVHQAKAQLRDRMRALGATSPRPYLRRALAQRTLTALRGT